MFKHVFISVAVAATGCLGLIACNLPPEDKPVNTNRSPAGPQVAAAAYSVRVNLNPGHHSQTLAANEHVAGLYSGSDGPFTTVVLGLSSGTYQMTLINLDGVPGFPTQTTMTKTDTAPTDVIGSYSDGAGITATVAVIP